MSHLNFQSWLGAESVTRFRPLSWLIIHSVPLLDETHTGGLAWTLSTQTAIAHNPHILLGTEDSQVLRSFPWKALDR